MPDEKLNAKEIMRRGKKFILLPNKIDGIDDSDNSDFFSFLALRTHSL